MTRRWTTPLVWLVFTALATTVGLASVSVVRKAVVSTSMQATSAKQFQQTLGTPEPVTPSTTASPASPTPTPSPSPTATRVVSTVPPTTQPTPTDSVGPAGPVDHPSHSPKPTTAGYTSEVFTQPFDFGEVSVVCQTGGVKLAGSAPVVANFPYRVAAISYRTGSIRISFLPIGSTDKPPVLVEVSCNRDFEPEWGFAPDGLSLD